MSISRRAALLAVGSIGLLASSTRTSVAQSSSSPDRSWEFRITSGGLVATGDQRNSLKDAQATAAQLSWDVRPSLAVTGTFGWARSRDIAALGSPKLDVFTSDLGIEARSTEWSAGRAVTFRPFAGAGAGVRSYNYRKLDVDATHNVAGYVSAGGELGIRRVGVRLEVRDYATGFKPLVGAGRSEMRNDVVMMVGLRFNRRSAGQ